MATDPNSLEAVKSKLTAKTLQDIEGLDPLKYGFGRKECCGPIPSKIIGSMKLQEHIFLNSVVPPTDWAKRSENVPGYPELEKLLEKERPKATFTVSHLSGDIDDSLICFKVNDETKAVDITEYCGLGEPYKRLPWHTKGTLAVDRSSEYFIYICTHFMRDERCGYCGSVLVDLFRHATRETMGTAAAPRVTVYPCSHVGGHIYAGNVLIYSRHGGVCYGLFKPEDVQTVVDAIKEDKGAVPESLKTRIRGQMGPLAQ